MELLYILLVLLVVTRAFGEIAERLGQPELVGQLLSGIALGVIVARFSDRLPILSDLTENEVFLAVTDLGVFFLMLLAGVELHPHELAKSSREAVLVAVGGMLVPFGAGLAMGWTFLPASPYRLAQALFIGTALAITAVPVAVKILLDLGKLQSRLGQIVISAAVIDDVLSLVLLAVLTAVIRTGELPAVGGVLLLVGKIVLFFAVATIVGWVVLPRLGRWIKRFRVEEFELTALLVGALALSLLAEWLHMHFILGAFVAGVFFGRRVVDESTYERVRRQVSGITTAFLAPIFFASIGLHLQLDAVVKVPAFLVTLIVVAFLGKLVGSGLTALLAGLSVREASGAGLAMSARGAVELIIADVALRAGLFSRPDPPPPVVANLFSSVVAMAVVTTVVAPVALRLMLGSKRNE